MFRTQPDVEPELGATVISYLDAVALLRLPPGPGVGILGRMLATVREGGDKTRRPSRATAWLVLGWMSPGPCVYVVGTLSLTASSLPLGNSQPIPVRATRSLPILSR